MSVAPQRFETPEDAARWLRSLGVRALVTDHRDAAPDTAFLAWPGTRHDARRHLPEAFAAGARACLADGQAGPALAGIGGHAVGPIGLMDELKARAGLVADAFYGHPSTHVRVVASTGTNGKTSTTWWIAQALGAAGSIRPEAVPALRCGVIGTLGVGVPPDHVVPAGLTTPDAVRVHAALREFADRDIRTCAIEASSIGIAEQRLSGVRIQVALFTNLTQDHLDYHGTMEAYWAAKRRLFDWYGLAAAVVNVDDPRGAALAVELAGRPGLDLWTVGDRTAGAAAADVRLAANHVRHGPRGGLAFTLCEADTTGANEPATAEVSTRVVGRFNVHNLLAVAGAMRALGLPLQTVADALGAVIPVPGRMQRLDAPDDAPAVVVDYAHTPDALEKVLRSLQTLARDRGGRLWCVVGCGGNRDPGKRPLMAAVAEAEADRVVLTSDNPRDESPRLILAQMATGLSRPDDASVVEDRREAISWAVGRAAPADVVLLAGKGHEAYQEIAGVRHPFSDATEALATLAARPRVAVAGGAW